MKESANKQLMLALINTQKVMIRRKKTLKNPIKVIINYQMLQLIEMTVLIVCSLLKENEIQFILL